MKGKKVEEEEEGNRDGDEMGTILEEPVFTNTIEVTNPAGMWNCSNLCFI